MKTILPERSEAHADVIKRMCERILKYYKDKISHIILFGSFARGDWVYDRYREKLPDGRDGAWLEYASDYDLLVLTRTEKFVCFLNVKSLESCI